MTLLELLVKELPVRGGWPDKNMTHIFTSLEGKVCYEGSFPRGSFYHNRKEYDVPDLFLESRLISRREVEVVTREQYEAAIAAQQPAWNGEGLPPVGVKVEWLSEQYGWIGGTVAAHDAKYPLIAIIRHNDGYTGCHRHEIRTEADRKRECVVDALLSLGTSLTGPTASIIYDAISAGKIPGVEITK